MKINFATDSKTQHFKASESIKTKYGENTPTNSEIIRNIRLLAHKMELVRILLGDKGIVPTSWYRCPAVNKAAGGSATSDHMNGSSIDFKHTVYSNKEVYEKLQTPEAKEILGYDQLIYYPNSVHCHIGWKFDGTKNRGQHFSK